MPPTATVTVDCGSGQSINAALATPADVLTVEIIGYNFLEEFSHVVVRDGSEIITGTSNCGTCLVP